MSQMTFVSLDVKSLYTNVPNAYEGAQMNKSLKNYPNRTMPTNVITAFLALILTLNILYSTVEIIHTWMFFAMKTSVRPHMQIFLRTTPEKNAFTPLVKGSY